MRRLAAIIGAAVLAAIFWRDWTTLIAAAAAGAILIPLL